MGDEEQQPPPTHLKPNGPIAFRGSRGWNESQHHDPTHLAILRPGQVGYIFKDSTMSRNFESEAQSAAQAQQVVWAAEQHGQAGVLTTTQTK